MIVAISLVFPESRSGSEARQCGDHGVSLQHHQIFHLLSAADSSRGLAADLPKACLADHSQHPAKWFCQSDPKPGETKLIIHVSPALPTMMT